MDKLNNKRGQFSIVLTVGTLIVIAVIIALIFTGVITGLYFIKQYIFAIAGVLLLIFSFILLSKKSINQKFGIFLIILSVVLLLVQFSGVTQSVLSVDTVTTTDGKTSWIINMAADNIDEKFTFVYKAENKTLSNGSIIVPTNSMTLTFSKDKSYCQYYITKESYKVLGITLDSYYVINSVPTRVATIKITDKNGNYKIIDALSSSTVSMTDDDGKGIILIKPYGSSISSQDCYSSQDIIIKEINGEVKYFDKAEYINKLSKYSSWNPLQIVNSLFTTLTQDTGFIKSFNTGTLKISSDYTKLTGEKDLGSPLFTITADQDVFESVLYTPPKLPSADISFTIPSLTVGESSSFKATIKNTATGTSGIVKITSSTVNCNIDPSVQEITLKDSSTISYRIISNVKGDCKVTLKACASSQFEVKCDSATYTTTVLEKNILNPITTNKCGNGICESNEDYSTCSSDCKGQEISPTPENNESVICEDKFFGLIPASISTTSKCDWYDLLCQTGITKPTQVSECKYDYGVILLIIGGIIVVVGMFLLIKPNKPTSKIKYVYRRRK